MTTIGQPSPSTSSTASRMGNGAAAAGPSNSRLGGDGRDMWSDILKSAGNERRRSIARKNIILLAERRRGRTTLLEKLGAKRARKQNPLAIGYDVIPVEVDDDSTPPLSVFYPPSRDPTLVDLVRVALPPQSMQDTAVVIVLDWTRPSLMAKELAHWLAWVDNWAHQEAQPGEAQEMRDRLQSHIQHYVEPSPPITNPTIASSNNNTSNPTATLAPPLTSTTLSSLSLAAAGATSSSLLLPLGPGSLTSNQSGVPVIVVCTRADLMDSVGDEMGMKGAGWEERTDWVQQVLRTICLAYGAALFYTAPTQPQTYTLLKSYLLHRLYTIPPPLHLDSSLIANPPAQISSNGTTPRQQPSIALSGAASVSFPFLHRANVLDRDTVMVPSGWDSYGKINVLREGFEPERVRKAWESSIRRIKAVGVDIEGVGVGDDESEGIEDLWLAMIPDTERGPKPSTMNIPTAAEPEQAFLARHLEILLKDSAKDPRASFRAAATAAGTTPNLSALQSSSVGVADGTALGMAERRTGVVGPLGTGGLSLPGVEKAMVEMEGGSAEDMKERFSRLARRESSKAGSGGGLPGPLSPTSPTGDRPAAVPNEALHNFFQGLLATRTKTTTPAAGLGKSARSPGEGSSGKS